MRYVTIVAVLVTLAFGGSASAQLVSAPGATPPASAPAKPAQSAIIPGSPLAALTGASSATPAPDAATPAPFGTDSIGLSLTSGIGGEVSKTLGNFSVAVRRSTALLPVVTWLENVVSQRAQQQLLGKIALALAMTFVPGLLVEVILKIAIMRPSRALIRHVAVRQTGPGYVPLEARGLADAEAGEVERAPSRKYPWRSLALRAGFGLAHFGLSLLPIIGFALTIQALVTSGIIVPRAALLADTGFVNAYLFYRIARECLGLVLAPKVPMLRLVGLTDRHASRLMRSLLIVLGTGLFGFAFISSSQILGLSRTGVDVLKHLLALMVHIEIALTIWRGRRLVGRWLAGPVDRSNAFSGFRQWLGRIWYIPALFYILALWLAWAGGVQDAFGVMLRVVLVSVGAIVLGRLALVGSQILLERIFATTADEERERSAVYTRAQAYNPVFRSMLRLLIGFFVLLIVLQGWGVNAAGWLLTNSISRVWLGTLIYIVVTIVIAAFLWESANVSMQGLIRRLSTDGRTSQASRLRTLLPMFKAAVFFVIFLLTISICLTKIGVNINTFLELGGVIGIAIGFGSQKLVQDIITGLFLLFEDAMQVGDVVALGGISGTVERLSIRTICLRGDDGSMNIIPFSAVTTVTNKTRDFGLAQISIDVGYNEDLTHVYAVLREIASAMRSEPLWSSMIRDDLKIFGLDQFGQSALIITGQIRTGPGQHWAVRREFYGRVKHRFAEENIEIPYNNQRLTIERATIREAFPGPIPQGQPAPGVASRDGEPA